MEFEIVSDPLGVGKEGTVHMVRMENGYTCVMKQFKKTKKINKLKKEASLQKMAADIGISPAVLHVDETNKRIFMDGLPKKLLSHLKKYGWSNNIKIQIQNIMTQLDRIGVLHNDGNILNFMMNYSGKIFIIDFGFSKKIDNKMRRTCLEKSNSTPNFKYTLNSLKRSLKHNNITHNLD